MKEYSVWLLLCARLTRNKKVRLMELLGGAGGVFEAGRSRLLDAMPTLGVEELSALLDRDLTRAREICARLDALGASVVDFNDYLYPPLLREIDDPPVVLFVRGALPQLADRLCIGVVGQRRATVSGLKTAADIAYGLSKSGAVVVSGMAAGIDGAAHRGALDGGSPTVAVFGTAIDKCYPAENASLMRRIIENGAVVSEYPPGMQTHPGSFVQRNRIISGMSRGVLVVEAKGKSGSLVTAQRALEQNRDVFAVPGPVGLADHEGTNRLIKDGAAVATSADDILECYQNAPAPRLRRGQEEIDLSRIVVHHMSAARPAPQRRTEEAPVDERPVPQAAPRPAPKRAPKKAPAQSKAPEPALDESERAILEAVGKIAHADEIARRTGIPAGQLMAKLTMMEIKGLLTKRPGNYFEVKRQTR